MYPAEKRGYDGPGGQPIEEARLIERIGVIPPYKISRLHQESPISLQREAGLGKGGARQLMHP